ncbi:MAG: hypothetical protein H7839_14180 [Magnetococcus sp. YQC-5]
MPQAITFNNNMRQDTDAICTVLGTDLGEKPLQLASEDEMDIKIAKQRLAEIDAHPEKIVRGQTLEARLKQWES